MKAIPLLAVLAILSACAENYVTKACDTTEDQSVRYGARESAAREGLYVKCVAPDRGWNEYTLMLDGEAVPDVE